jgi:hypothetical protein
MSRSRPILRNPTVRWFQWAGRDGKLTYYDRETKETVEVPLPFEFMPLDQLGTVSGYDKGLKAFFRANEVRSTRKEPLTVMLGSSVVERGYYRELTTKGIKYAQSIYIAFRLEDGKWAIGNFTAVGSALSAWFDYTKNKIVENGKTVITRGGQMEAGTGPYFPPAFKYDHCDADETDAAWKLDQELQQYLDQLHESAEHNRAEQVDDTEPPVTGSDVLGTGDEIPDLGDEPINLNDIPF